MDVFRIFIGIIIATFALFIFGYAGVIMYETLGFIGVILYGVVFTFAIAQAFFN